MHKFNTFTYIEPPEFLSLLFWYTAGAEWQHHHDYVILLRATPGALRRLSASLSREQKHRKQPWEKTYWRRASHKCNSEGKYVAAARTSIAPWVFSILLCRKGAINVILKVICKYIQNRFRSLAALTVLHPHKSKTLCSICSHSHTFFFPCKERFESLEMFFE